MTVVRLRPIAGRVIGPALASIDRAVLARRAGAAFADVPPAELRRFTRALALAGVAASPCDVDLAPSSGALLANAVDLRPLPPVTVDLDVVRVERVPLGRATREVFRRRLLGALPASAADRSRCRALLRREDALLAWSRRAWGSRDQLRSADARRVLRPVVFTRDAAVRWDLAGRTTANDDRIAAWLFA